MSLIEQTLIGRIDKVAIAIERIKSYDPLANGFMNTPYYVAYSGGKDSDVLRILFEISGAKYDLVNNHTTVDAPETVRYIRTIPNIQINPPRYTMWELIEKKKMPPTRLARYCCAELKERGGKDRLVATGVRWAESTARKNNRNSVEVIMGDRQKSLVLNADNDENRRLFERCSMKGKRMLNPIIDWSNADVWEFLQHHGCSSNPLYQCGYKRVGCIGCPMAGGKKMEEDFTRYPKYKAAYIRAFDRMLLARQENGLVVDERWRNGQGVYDWWVSDRRIPIADENQLSIWDALES